MKYPVSKKSIVIAFPELGIDASNIHIQRRVVQEASVYGEWSPAKLAKAFRRAGFEQIGPKGDLTFVNQDSTVGLVCYGVTPDPKSNRFKTLSFEIQARSIPQASQGVAPAAIF